jgi:hypothetical protein
MACRSTKGIGPTSAGEQAALHGLQRPHGMVVHAFDLEMEGRHIREQARAHEVVRVGARLRALLGRAIEEAGHRAHRLQVAGHAELIE